MAAAGVLYAFRYLILHLATSALTTTARFFFIMVKCRPSLLGAVGLLLAGVMLPGKVFAQREEATGRKNIVTNNLSNYDTRWFHPGFFVALNASRFKPDFTTASVAAAGSVHYSTRVRTGFTVGFIGDVRFHEYLTVRFVPGVGFYTREVKRDVVESPTQTLRDTAQQVGNTADRRAHV